MSAPHAPWPHAGLRRVVGATLVLAPLLHAASDVVEALQGGFSALQLAFNYAAFLPMPWLLLGACAVLAPRPAAIAWIGALVYGAAFVYFTHTTWVAWESSVPTYDALRARLGPAYTAHGAAMVLGGLAFACPLARHPDVPPAARWAFGAGLLAHAVLWALPTPEVGQIAGSLVRNAGLVALGIALLRRRA